MIFGFAILATALLLSAVAAYYSVAGLVAIFSAATIPVIIMGGSLELGKIAATVWLHNNWRRAGWAFKAYLIPAVTFLMILTSMGIFGYLSKAHSDQSLVSGDVQSRIAIYDEKIRTARENIEAARRQLKQMDEAVDQVMARSSSEEGATKANNIRRAQQRERSALAREIETNQKQIAALNEESAPIRAEVRKVEAEVGPIKYIAALIYGDNPDANLLERAVRWMIIMIVLVFDPLALALILAANKQFEWARQGRGGWDHDDPKYPADDGPLTDKQLDQIKSSAIVPPPDNIPWHERYPYLAKPFVHFANLKPMVVNSTNATEGDPESEDEPATVKAAIKAWKAHNPDKTLKEERRRHARGEIAELPWMKLVADNVPPRETKSTFGTVFPSDAAKGDMFVKVDQLPSKLFKFNGNDWIAVDKNLTDNYTYDSAYIDHLIAKVESGELDIDLLSDSERDQIASRLSNTRPL
jgi:hypothetical protein